MLRAARGASAVVACSALVWAGLALAGTPVVRITAAGPQPPSSTVAWGGTVRFTNADSVPHVLRLTGGASAHVETVAAGASYDAVFGGRKGTLRYTVSGGHQRFRGSVSVGLSGQLTLSADTSAVVYGEKLQLRGQTTLGRMPVTIQMEPLGQARAAKKGDWTDVADVRPAADGSFAVAVSPTVAARYRATTAATQLRSADVHVRVTPSVRSVITPRSSALGGRVVASARVFPASAAQHAVLARFVPDRKTWVPVARGVVTAGRVRIPWKVDRPGRLELRLELDGGSGFAAASSDPVILNVAWPATVLSMQTVSASPTHPRFAPTQLTAHPGRITVLMQNLDSARHSIAIRGEGVDVRGRVVAHDGVSRVTAVLQAGKYMLYSAVDGVRSELVGVLLVR